MNKENINNIVVNSLNKIFRVAYPSQSPEDIRKEYGIPDKVEVDITITNDGYFVITSKGLPGLITEAKDGKELLRMFNDAILTYYDVPKKVGDIVHDKIDIHGYGTFRIENNKVMQEA